MSKMDKEWLDAMKKAYSDPQFQKECEQIMEEFKYADAEALQILIDEETKDKIQEDK